MPGRPAPACGELGWKRRRHGAPNEPKPAPALILAGHGVSLRIEGGALTIQNGFTHYPQKRETIRYFSRRLVIARANYPYWTAAAAFPLTSYRGSPSKKSALFELIGKATLSVSRARRDIQPIPYRVQWQLETRENPGLRNDFCRSIITKKIEASIFTLEKSIPRSDKWERAMKSAYAALTRLDENPPETISELRALEANCAASYFRSWVGMPIKWRGTSRRPIPDNWHSIGQRSSPYHLAGNRNAAHPVNAILNYAYAALESEIRIKAISDGYDPTIGIMHEGSDGSSKFIFDLMEPERPKVDRAVLGFRQGTCFRSGGFCHSHRRCLPA